MPRVEEITDPRVDAAPPRRAVLREAERDIGRPRGRQPGGDVADGAGRGGDVDPGAGQDDVDHRDRRGPARGRGDVADRPTRSRTRGTSGTRWAWTSAFDPRAGRDDVRLGAGERGAPDSGVLRPGARRRPPAPTSRPGCWRTSDGRRGSRYRRRGPGAGGPSTVPPHRRSAPLGGFVEAERGARFVLAVRDPADAGDRLDVLTGSADSWMRLTETSMSSVAK